MAYLPDHREPILILAGTLVDEGSETSDTVLLALDDTHAVSAPGELRAFLRYLERPRDRSAAQRWLGPHGHASGLIDQLIAARRLLQVDPSSPEGVLASFAGHRVVPTSRPVDVPHPAGLIYLRKTEWGTAAPISPLLAQAMWFSNPGEDLPSAARRFTGGMDAAVAARSALGGLGGALELGLARLEVVPGIEAGIGGLPAGRAA